MTVNGICPHCLNKTGVGKICTSCGFDMESKRGSSYLPYGEVIAGRYYVGKILDKNSDGFTYLGIDLSDNSKIRIREFFPSAICKRADDGKTVEVTADNDFLFNKTKSEFLALWRKLAQLRGISSLVSVFDITECNSTVYAVAEYNDDITLRDYLMSNNGFLPWDRAKPLLMPVLNCLKALHVAGVYHLGISPYTLLVGADGKVRVWGFSIKEVRCANNIFKTEIYEGFAPVECYKTALDVSQKSDVYSFAAVLYRTLIGSVPIDSDIRYVNDTLVFPAAFVEKSPAYLINALNNALKVMPENRTDGIDRLREELSATPGTVEKLNTSHIQSAEPVKKKEKIAVSVISNKGDELSSVIKRERIIFISVIVALIAVITAGFMTKSIVFNKKESTDVLEDGSETRFQSYEVVEVPNFIGADKDNNDFAISYPYLKIIYEQANVSYSPKNKIVAQSIAAGTFVKKDSVVILSYYGETGEIILPDFTGYTQEEALIELGQLGVNNAVIEKKENLSGSAEGTVAEQVPSGNSVITGDDKVVIYVWDKTVETTVPVQPETTTAPQISQGTANATSIIDSIFDGIGGLFR